MMVAVVRDLPSGTVSFLFTDVEGSTRLLQELGAAGYAEALAEHRKVIRECCARHGGVEVDTQGDAFFVAFPTAPGALVAVGEALAGLAGGPIRVRMGIHTGTAQLDGEGYVGVDVYRAARIAACGHGGQVLVSASTAALVGTDGLRDLGEHRLKDLTAPERIYQLGAGDFPPLQTLYRTNLPIPSTPFLGRGSELVELTELLGRDDVRLVTLTGPGGTGKTRLALQAAAAVSDAYPDGVWWVALAPLRDPGLVLREAEQALEARLGLSERIGDKRLLLVFDNFEHLLEAAPGLADLLGGCPNLRLLVTSRGPLHLSGEREYPVPSLTEDEAMELFRARAAIAEPEATVRAICRRLDCLPLATELAAARTKALSPDQILGRLEQRLPLLTGGPRDAPGRQQTLRATIEWSHELLSPVEQRLFARLAVFAGGCTLEAAEAVCAADLDTLQSLVEKSLVRHSDERYWMLDTIREYAQERLEPTAEDIRRRHARFYSGYAAAVGPALDRPGRVEAAADLDRELANIRVAFAQSLGAGERGEVLAAFVGIWRYLQLRGHAREGMRWFDEAREAKDLSAAVRLNALRGAAALARELGQLTRLEALSNEMLTLARRDGDVRMTGIAISNLAFATPESASDPDRARSLLEEAAAMLRQAGDDVALCHVMNHLAYAALATGDLRGSAAYAEEAHAVASRIGDAIGAAIAFTNLGCGDLLGGRYADAEARYLECLTYSDEAGYTNGVGYAYEGLAATAAHRGERVRAARLLGAAAALWEATGTQLDFVEQGLHDDVVEQLKSALGPSVFAAECAAGHELPPREAISYAIALST
jgi:predicted ATPase/class 3 adenylate cyclase